MGFTGDFDGLIELQRKLHDIGDDKTKLLIARSVAAEYQSFMEDCFHEGRSPYGDKWAELKSRTSSGDAASVAAGKVKAQVPLSDTSIMKNAMTPKNVTAEGFQVTVSHPGANVHQYGATIVPKNAKALKFRGVNYHTTMSKSGRSTTRRKYSGWIFARKVVIPARPYAPLNGMPPELDQRVTDAINDAIEELIGR